MIIHSKQDKKANLYRSLEDPKSTVMVLSGGLQAALVHAYTEGPDAVTPWQVCFLIANLDVLAEAEKREWFGGAHPEKYIVLGGEDHSWQAGTDTPDTKPNQKKLVAERGPMGDLMLSNTEVDPAAVSTAFAKGDQL